MPLNASEIEGFTEAVQVVIDTNKSVDPDGGKLVARTENGSITANIVKASQFQLSANIFAGERTAIDDATSNDPDDLLDKINELIAVVNLSRQ